MKKLLSILPFAAAILALFACGPSKPVLRICVWSDYIEPEAISAFEKKFDCRVIVDTFPDNEMLYSKMKMGGAKYDLLMPSSYMASLMNGQNMLMKLDHSKLPNAVNVDKKYLEEKAVDKKMEYSAPYMVCYGCMAYDTEKASDLEESWKLLGDPAFKKRTCVLSDIRELIGAALKANGYSLNSTNDAELAKARETLLVWRDNAAKFDSEAYKPGIVTGEFTVVQGYSGDLLQVAEEKKTIKVILPKEGMSISVDDWVIPTNAENPDLAHAFINYMMDPEVAIQNMNYAKYDAANSKAREIMPDEMKSQIFFNIPQDILDKSEVIQNLGEDISKYNTLWDELKL